MLFYSQQMFWCTLDTLAVYVDRFLKNSGQLFYGQQMVFSSTWVVHPAVGEVSHWSHAKDRKAMVEVCSLDR